MEEKKCNPRKTRLHAGMQYSWCRCGRSKGPFCDGSHRGTGILPLLFVAEEDGEAEICMCRQTSTPPYCDKSRKDHS